MTSTNANLRWTDRDTNGEDDIGFVSHDVGTLFTTFSLKFTEPDKIDYKMYSEEFQEKWRKNQIFMNE